MNKTEKRDFEDVVTTIKQAESDVDKVLDAARLERHEERDNRLSAEQKMTLITYGMILIAVICLLVFMLVPFFLS